jgi:Sulfotransferase domain
MRNLNWLASFPKSGNTWARMFVAAYLSDDASFELKQVHNFSRSESLLSIFADIAGKPSEELTDEDINTHRMAVQERMARNVGQRVVKTHNARLTQGSRRQIFSRYTRTGIYVVRNPLDIVDSLADHTNLSIDATIDLMNRPGQRFEGHQTKLGIKPFA